MFTGLFKDARFGPFSNLHVYFTCGSLSLWTMLELEFSHIFFSLACFRAFRDAPHSRFKCRDPSQCLPIILKMLLLALAQIYTRVFHLWKSVDLDSV